MSEGRAARLTGKGMRVVERGRFLEAGHPVHVSCVTAEQQRAPMHIALDDFGRTVLVCDVCGDRVAFDPEWGFDKP